jgi:hypothetical protein
MCSVPRPKFSNAVARMSEACMRAPTPVQLGQMPLVRLPRRLLDCTLPVP